LRQRFEILREFPGTYTLTALWAAVYAAMVVSQAAGWTPAPDPRTYAGLGPLGIGAVSEQTGQVFGAWNSAQILSGQIWRTVTATFVHFGLVHLALNVFGLIQLGRFIEEWYGPRLLLGSVVLMGFFGNGLAALARPVVGHPSGPELMITSGGGSTVVFGMIGLIAMVGKRSRSRMGRYLYNQMIGLLAFNFLIGLTIPQIDNYAHAGGAIAGAVLGFMHRTLISWHDNRPRLCRAALVFSFAAVIAGAVGQYWIATIEKRMHRIERRVQTLSQIGSGVSEVRARFVSRAALGLRGSQIIRSKGRFALPGATSLLIPIPQATIETNRLMLSRSIDKTSAMIRELNSPQLLAAWAPLLAEARRGVSRPPSSQDIESLVNGVKAVDDVLIQEVEAANAEYLAEAKRRVLWRMPWPNVAWTDVGPVLKSGPSSIPGRANGADRLPNRPTGLPSGQPRVVPRPGSAPSQSGDEVAH
jgi:membrane associated rhomboid family serine protease